MLVVPVDWWGTGAAVSGGALPLAPVFLIVSPVSGTTLRLDWTGPSTNELGFSVERSLDGLTGWAEIDTTAPNVVTYTDSGLTPATAFYYRVRAYNAAGYSSYTNVDAGTTNAGGGGSIAFAQSIGGDSAVGADVTLTAASGTTTGNHVLIAVLFPSSANDIDITDDAGNTYVDLATYDVGEVVDDGVRRVRLFVGEQATGLGAGDEIQVMSDGMPISIDAVAVEFSGIEPSGSGWIEGDAAFNTGTAVDGNTALSAGGTRLVLAAVAHANPGTAYTPDAGYTAETPVDVTTYGRLRLLWRIDGVVGGTSYGDLGGSEAWCLLVACLAAA